MYLLYYFFLGLECVGTRKGIIYVENLFGIEVYIWGRRGFFSFFEK